MHHRFHLTHISFNAQCYVGWRWQRPRMGYHSASQKVRYIAIVSFPCDQYVRQSANGSPKDPFILQDAFYVSAINIHQYMSAHSYVRSRKRSASEMTSPITDDEGAFEYVIFSISLSDGNSCGYPYIPSGCCRVLRNLYVSRKSRTVLLHSKESWRNPKWWFQCMIFYFLCWWHTLTNKL